MPEISVVMTLYRPDPRLLGEAIESILRQTLPDFELIIIEDVSDVSGETAIARFKDPRIYYELRRTRTSFVDQKNAGLRRCSADLVAFCDGDDVCAESRLETQRHFLASNPDISVVGSNIETIDAAGRTIGCRIYSHDHRTILRDIRRFVPFCHPSVMVRRDAIMDVGGYHNISLPAEDYDLWSRMAIAGYRFANVQEPLLQYRLHDQQIKRTMIRECVLGVVAVKERYWMTAMSVSEWARMSIERYATMLPDWLLYEIALRLMYKRVMPMRWRYGDWC